MKKRFPFKLGKETSRSLINKFSFIHFNFQEPINFKRVFIHILFFPFHHFLWKEWTSLFINNKYLEKLLSIFTVDSSIHFLYSISPFYPSNIKSHHWKSLKLFWIFSIQLNSSISFHSIWMEKKYYPSVLVLHFILYSFQFSSIAKDSILDSTSFQI